MFYLTIALYALLLLMVARVSARLPVVSRMVLLLAVAFWAFSYVVRPISIVLIQPDRGNPLYDSRLAAIGYEDGLVPILQLVLLGHLALFVAYFFTAARLEERRRRASARFGTSGAGNDEAGRHPSDPSPMAKHAVSILYAAGWAGRALSLGGAGAVSGLLAPVGSVGAALLILNARGARAPRTILLILAAEASWSVLASSKTPINAALVAVVLRLAVVYAKQPGARWRLPIAAAGVLMTAVVAFLAIQPLKGIDTSASVASYSNSRGPLIGPMYALLQRADGVNTVQDAVAFPQPPWMSATEYVGHVAINAAPVGPLIDKGVGNGLLWTREVRTYSNLTQYQDVSVAFGPVAEGFVQAGVLGVVFFSAALGALYAMMASLLTSRSLPWQVYAATYIFGNGFLERGLLSALDNTAKALQAAAFALAILALVRTVRGSRVVRPFGTAHWPEHNRKRSETQR